MNVRKISVILVIAILTCTLFPMPMAATAQLETDEFVRLVGEGVGNQFEEGTAISVQYAFNTAESRRILNVFKDLDGDGVLDTDESMPIAWQAATFLSGTIVMPDQMAGIANNNWALFSLIPGHYILSFRYLKEGYALGTDMYYAENYEMGAKSDVEIPFEIVTEGQLVSLDLGATQFTEGMDITATYQFSATDSTRCMLLFQDVNGNGIIDDGDVPIAWQAATSLSGTIGIPVQMAGIYADGSIYNANYMEGEQLPTGKYVVSFRTMTPNIPNVSCFVESADSAIQVPFEIVVESNSDIPENGTSYIPENVFSEDVFSNWFTAVNDAQLDETDDGYILHVIPQTDTYIYGKKAMPFSNAYTIHFKVQFTSTSGAVNFLLGMQENGNLPFTQFTFIPLYDTNSVLFQQYAWSNTGIDLVSEGIAVVDLNDWVEITVLVKPDAVDVFANDQILAAQLTGTNGFFGDSSYIGFRGDYGYDGYRVCDLEAYAQLGTITSIQPELTNAITLHYDTDVAEDFTARAQLKIVFKGRELWINNIDNVFAMEEILPQDMTLPIDAYLYVDGRISDFSYQYSVQKYCGNMLAKTTGTTQKDQALRALLVAILNYGAKAEEYFTAIQNGVADDILDDTMQSYLQEYDMLTAQGVIYTPVQGTQHADYTWVSATLGCYDTLRIRLKFKAKDILNTRVQVGQKIYGYEDFVIAPENAYYLYIDDVYAADFATSVTALFIDGLGQQIGQSVTYSVNTYISYIANKPSAEVTPLVQAIYNYGCAAYDYAHA